MSIPNLWILGFGLLMASWTLVPAFPHSSIARRLSPWMRLGALGVVGLASGGAIGAVLMIGLWLALPWLELGTRVRGIRLPEKISMKHRLPPGPDHFPDLRELSHQIEQGGFSRAADLGWESDSQKQFLRLFLDKEGTSIAALHCVEQGAINFSFSSVTQILQGGGEKPDTFLRSWTSPLPSGLSLPPGQRLNRVADAEDFAELLTTHEGFAADQFDASTDPEPHWRRFERDDVADLFQAEASEQLTHNCKRGILRSAPDGQLRYSFRGLVYLYGQVLRQMLALG